MKTVLGIDAAWTIKNPSGVALMVEEHDSWRCAGVAPSYQSFIDLAKGQPVEWKARLEGSEADLALLLSTSAELASCQRPSIVAVDMPLATSCFMGRREADRETSRRFGEFGCPVHSPTAKRPGKIGERLMTSLKDADYPLATTATDPSTRPATIEVYPHAAIVRLMRLKMRHKYKVSRSHKLWPNTCVRSRVRKLISAFHELKHALDREIADIDLPFPELGENVALSHLKPYEDALDALVCAWVGICYIEGRAEPFGNEIAAIWVPTV